LLRGALPCGSLIARWYLLCLGWRCDRSVRCLRIELGSLICAGCAILAGPRLV